MPSGPRLQSSAKLPPLGRGKDHAGPRRERFAPNGRVFSFPILFSFSLPSWLALSYRAMSSSVTRQTPTLADASTRASLPRLIHFCPPPLLLLQPFRPGSYYRSLNPTLPILESPVSPRDETPAAAASDIRHASSSNGEAS